jgi:bilirubin oxidase
MVHAAVRPRFYNPFKVPPLEVGRREGKHLYFDLQIQSGLSEIIPGLQTVTLGINQPFLGVTLRANRDDHVHFKVVNQLSKETTLHWHGMKLPAKEDGGPHQSIAPLGQWESDYKIDQPAATLWYHSHQLHQTGAQVYHGLAGMFIIDDEESQNLNLPSTYGVDDFPVIIQDRDFNADGSLQYLTTMRDRMMGKRGDTLLVNGVINPLLKVETALIRFRLLNGSNARTYQLEFNDQRSFSVIGSDGGLLEQAIEVRSIRLAPAERVEILVDLSDGTMPVLRQRPHDLRFPQREMSMMNRMMGEEQEFDIFQIDARKVVNGPVTLPSQLVSHSMYRDIPIQAERSFSLQMMMNPARFMTQDQFSINGKAMDMNRIDEVVKAGSVEVWKIKNLTMMPHPFHIHNVQFKIIKRRGRIKSHELGFKDTVLVHPNETVHLMIHFPEYRDAVNPYMYHCHILEHEDQGMMGQFVVT